MKNGGIRVQVTKGPNKGAEYGYASEAVARKHLGDDFTILAHVDRSEYVAPKADAKKAEPKTGDKG